VPESLEEMEELFSGRTAEERATIVQRVLKCNHPKLGNNNREKLQPFFEFVLRLAVMDAATAAKLTSLLYELAQFSPQPSAKFALTLVHEKYEEYALKPRIPPAVDTV